MMLDLLAAGLLQLGQPCQPPGVMFQASDIVANGRAMAGPVARGAVVEFTVRAVNNGPDSYTTADLAFRVDSADRVDRLDGLSIEVAEADFVWRPLERTAGTPNWSFAAPAARFSLPAGATRAARFRMHLVPDLAGRLTPGASVKLSGVDCAMADGFGVVLARPPDPPPPPAPWSLPAGIGTGVLAGLLAWAVQAVLRHPARLARRARS
jgi:hypothetical protein